MTRHSGSVTVLMARTISDRVNGPFSACDLCDTNFWVQITSQDKIIVLCPGNTLPLTHQAIRCS